MNKDEPPAPERGSINGCDLRLLIPLKTITPGDTSVRLTASTSTAPPANALAERLWKSWSSRQPFE